MRQNKHPGFPLEMRWRRTAADDEVFERAKALQPPGLLHRKVKGSGLDKKGSGLGKKGSGSATERRRLTYEG